MQAALAFRENMEASTNDGESDSMEKKNTKSLTNYIQQILDRLENETEEMAQQLRVLAVPSGVQSLSPSTHFDSSQLSETPAPGYPTPSSCIQGHQYTYVNT